MRIAWFSPLPPTPSGISDYSMELLPFIAEGAAVDVFAPPPLRRRGRRPKLQVPDGTRVLDPGGFDDPEAYDAVFYHLGNNPFHGFVYDAVRRHPDIAVFHDYVLHHLLEFLFLEEGRHDFAGYGELLTDEYGEVGKVLASLRTKGAATDLEKFLFPLNGHIIRSSREIVVHSQLLAERVRQVAPEVPVTVIPHHAGTAPPEVADVTREEARAQLGLPTDAFVVGQFGFITRPKQPGAVLEAFARLSKVRPDALLVVVGANQLGLGVESLTERLGFGDRVRLAGFVDLASFYLYVKACDVVVNVRYPSAGEASGTLARALAEGRTAIVTNLGAFADLPPGVALKVEVDGDQAKQVGEHLVALAEDGGLKRAIENRARTYARTVLDPGRCAGLYLDVARGARAARDRVMLSAH